MTGAQSEVSASTGVVTPIREWVVTSHRTLCLVGADIESYDKSSDKKSLLLFVSHSLV